MQSRMYRAVNSFPDMCEDALKIGLPEVGFSTGDINSIVFAGMGGSGITGDLIMEFLNDSRIPMGVCKGFELPAHASDGTLVFCISYSGNTAETLAVFREAVRRGCMIVCVASGGELAGLARENSLPLIRLPPGLVAPRAALPFLFFTVMNLLKRLGISKTDLENLVGFLKAVREECERDAKNAAENLKGTMPFIYGTSRAACSRLKNQLNENAKMHAKFELLPELNHNEISGWQSDDGHMISVVLLRNSAENEHVRRSLEFLKEKISAPIIEVFPKSPSQSPEEELMYLVLFSDFLSCLIAGMRGTSPEPTEYIGELKRRLSAQKSI